jgi:hypothetical protein
MVGSKVFSTKQGYLKCLWIFQNVYHQFFLVISHGYLMGITRKKMGMIFGLSKALGAGLYWIWAQIWLHLVVTLTLVKPTPLDVYPRNVSNLGLGD